MKMTGAAANFTKQVTLTREGTYLSQWGCTLELITLWEPDGDPPRRRFLQPILQNQKETMSWTIPDQECVLMHTVPPSQSIQFFMRLMLVPQNGLEGHRTPLESPFPNVTMLTKSLFSITLLDLVCWRQLEQLELPEARLLWYPLQQ